MTTNGADDKEFTFDVLRTIVLGKMMSYWGVPELRKRLTGEKGSVEIYRIPSQASAGLVRYATFGLSQLPRRNGELGVHELLFVIDEGNFKNSASKSFDFMCELSANYLESAHEIELPSLVPPSALIPWRANALLFDEARGEEEDLAEMVIGARRVKLIWVIPLYEDEYKLIEKEGLAEFDRRCEVKRVDLVDIDRESVA